MTMTPTAENIRAVLALATRWMCVSDIFNALPQKASPGAIRRALGRETPGTYKSMKVPGDSKGRKQWALDVDTTGWANATPSKVTYSPRNRRMTQMTLPYSNQAKPYVAAATVIAINPRYKGFPMCLPVTTAAKTSLIMAVGDLVTNEFLPGQKKFSAHDVTKRLRELVSQPTTAVNPAETGTVNVKGKAVPKVEHEDVRNIVHELFNQGLLAGYDRYMDGGHWTYDLTANVAAAIPAPVVQATQAPDPVIVAGTDGGSYDGSSTI